jgi:hypothetical protein
MQRRRPPPLGLDALGPLTLGQRAGEAGLGPGAPGEGAPRTQVDEIRAAVPGPFRTIRAHYAALLKANEGRQEGQKWIEQDMRKAAGIGRTHAFEVRRSLGPDTPRTAEVRAFLGQGAPADGRDTATSKYCRALDANDGRPDEQKWPEASMVKAAGINRASALQVRHERAPDTPRTAEVRAFLEGDTATHGKETGADRFRRADAENAKRPENERWPDSSMAKAAGVGTQNLATIRKRRAPGTGEPQA